MHPEIAKHIVFGFLSDTPKAEHSNSLYGLEIAKLHISCGLAKVSKDYADAANQVVAFYNRFW